MHPLVPNSYVLSFSGFCFTYSRTSTATAFSCINYCRAKWTRDGGCTGQKNCFMEINVLRQKLFRHNALGKSFVHFCRFSFLACAVYSMKTNTCDNGIGAKRNGWQKVFTNFCQLRRCARRRRARDKAVFVLGVELEACDFCHRVQLLCDWNNDAEYRVRMN